MSASPMAAPAGRGASQSGSTPTKRRIEIRCEDRGARIVIVDSAFNKVASGIGHLQSTLSNGIYKARITVGSIEQDRLFEIDGQSVVLEINRFPIISPIPVERVTNSHEYQSYPAIDLAKSKAKSIGKGGQLLVFARDSAHLQIAPPLDSSVWRSLQVRDLRTGKQCFDVVQDGHTQAASGFTGAKLALNPGPYSITVDEVTGGQPAVTMHLPVWVSADWCSHVYIDCASSESGEDQRALDLAGAALLMTRPNVALAEHADEASLGEVARMAFMQGARGISDDDLAALIGGKFDNPMLGIYAAHLLVRKPDADLQLLKTIVSNLQALISPDHPDVATLAARILHDATSAQPDLANLLAPPTLRASWDILRSLGLNNTGYGARYGAFRVAGSMWGLLRGTLPAIDHYPGLRAAPLASRSALRKSAPSPSLSADAGNLRIGRKAGLESAQQLRATSPQLTPFEQALRRRLLDWLAEDEHEEEFDPITLAAQFGVSGEEAVATFEKLHERLLSNRRNAVKLGL